MHPFYGRIQRVFKRSGSNRHRFCRKYGYNYQTLQTCWDSDKLPPGNFLQDVAREFHVSLDALVLGRVSVSVGEESPTLARLTVLLKRKSVADLLRIEGAIRMMEFLDLPDPFAPPEAKEDPETANDWADLEELPVEPDQESPGSR